MRNEQTVFASWCLFYKKNMNDFFRAIIAGFTAKRLGGGCLSTIVIFVIVYWALGKCN